jgi:hypothetical protein
MTCRRSGVWGRAGQVEQTERRFLLGLQPQCLGKARRYRGDIGRPLTILQHRDLPGAVADGDAEFGLA